MAKSGPKTKEGKSVVSLNAVQRGVLSESPVVPGFESAEAWETHRAKTIESFDPQSYLEGELAERTALLLWRLKRVSRFETESIGEAIKDAAFRIDTPEFDILKLMRKSEERLLFSEQLLDKVPRYEAHLHRQLIQTMHELEALQARRRGETTPLARLDVQSSESS